MRERLRNNPQRRTDRLIVLGVFILLPYALLNYSLRMPVAIALFLALHLLDVILKRDSDFYRLWQRKMNSKTVEETQ